MNFFSRLFRSRQINSDLSAELRAHLDEKVAEFVASGMPRREAELAARRQFGNSTLLEERSREVWRWRLIENLGADIRFALRMFRKNPAFAVVAIVTLALGIGANTAMYTIIRGAFTWNMGLDHPDRIVSVTSADPAHDRELSISYPDFRDFRQLSKSVAGIAAYRLDLVNLSDDASFPERYANVKMSANGFAVMQQVPLLGRDFLEEDERPGARHVVILSHHVWRDRYASDPAIVGKLVHIDEIPYSIIGVMPPERRFPEDADLWTPLIPDSSLERRENRGLLVFARMQDDARLPAVRAEFSALAENLSAQYPATNKNVSALVQPIAYIYGYYRMRPLLLVLFVAVGFVLLIACADVANLLLVRATSRSREISIRIALGAGKIAIVRQLLVESVLLSLVGGALGSLVALAGVRWFNSGLGSMQKPAWMNLSFDVLPLLYLSAISIGTGILFGLVPALRLSKSDVNATIKESSGAGSTGAKFGSRLSHILVGLQVALCVVLLVGAGLLIRSAFNIYSVSTGVNSANVLTVRLNLPDAKYPKPADWLAFHKQLQQRLSALPGVESAAFASNVPLGGSFDTRIQPDASSAAQDQSGSAGSILVSSDYFHSLGIAALNGRLFSPSDGTSGSPVAVVNQMFARKFWKSDDVLGRRFRIVDQNPPGQWLTIVGIIPDVLQNRRDSLQHDPLFYQPFADRPVRQAVLIARTIVPPSTLADSFRRAVQQADPNLPLYDVLTLEQRLEQNRIPINLFSGICGSFAAIAIVLACVGLYSVAAHSVRKRTTEIGVRMALGARRRDVARLVAFQSITPVAIGAAIGLIAAAAVSRVLQSILYGLSPRDPLTFLAAVLILVAAACFGCAVPVARAVSLNPIAALRHE